MGLCRSSLGIRKKSIYVSNASNRTLMVSAAVDICYEDQHNYNVNGDVVGIAGAGIQYQKGGNWEKADKKGCSNLNPQSSIKFAVVSDKEIAYITIRYKIKSSKIKDLCINHPIEIGKGIIITSKFQICDAKNKWVDTEGKSHKSSEDAVFSFDKESRDEEESENDLVNIQKSDDESAADQESDEETADDQESDHEAADEQESNQKAADDRESDHEAADDQESNHEAADDQESDHKAADDQESDKEAADDQESDQEAAGDQESDHEAADDQESDPEAADDQESDKEAADDHESEHNAADDQESDHEAANDQQPKTELATYEEYEGESAPDEECED